MTLEPIAAVLVRAFASGGKLLICGNGGSAADAQHIAAEFVGRYRLERQPLPAMALVDPATITAIGNDYGFEVVFSRQVIAHGRRGDVLLAISTSGTSPNVIAAIIAAHAREMTVVGFTGSQDMASLCDFGVVFAGATAEIQERYMAYAHVICGQVEQAWAERTA